MDFEDPSVFELKNAVVTPAAAGDIAGFPCLLLDLPVDSELYADKGYTDYVMEDSLKLDASITLIASRKKNSKRPHPGYVSYLCQVIR